MTPNRGMPPPREALFVKLLWPLVITTRHDIGLRTVVEVDTEQTRVGDFDDAARRRPKYHVAINTFHTLVSSASHDSHREIC